MTATDNPLPLEWQEAIVRLANEAYDGAFRDGLDAALLILAQCLGDPGKAVQAIIDLKNKGPK